MQNVLSHRMLDDFRGFRSFAVGFDNLLKEIMKPTESAKGYPPYNITQVSDGYRIDIALAGFSKEDINIFFDKNSGFLSISKRPTANEDDQNITKDQYIHKGISHRYFEINFRLADTVKIEYAKMVDGMLTIKLAEFTKEEKAVRIDIT